MTYYITKHALTMGIIELLESEIEAHDNGRIFPRPKGRSLLRYGAYPMFFSTKEWFTDRNIAQADAEKRGWKKIASVKKQLRLRLHGLHMC